MLENIIQDIIVAKCNGAYISALSLALTLPNILSNIEGGKKVGKAEYIDWFDKWVYKYFKSDEPQSELESMGRVVTEFDGANCYKLRCALFHSGNVDLQDGKGNRIIDHFELCKTSNWNYASACDISTNGAKNIHVSLNVIYLIDSLIAGTQEYITKNENIISKHKNGNFYTRIFGGVRIEEF